MTVGRAEGWNEGTVLGAGEAVGDPWRKDGLMVGFADGLADGFTVGGVGDGAHVGATVGFIEGPVGV